MLQSFPERVFGFSQATKIIIKWFGGIRGGTRGTRPPFKKTFVPRHPFDLMAIPDIFPKVSQPVADDFALTVALLKRNQDLNPTPAEQTSIANMVNKIQAVLYNLVAALVCTKQFYFVFKQLEEVCQVGSFKKGTMMTGNTVADIVIILKTLPIKEACEALAKKVETDLKSAMKTEVLTKADQIKTLIHDRGFDIFKSISKVRILIATLPQNMQKKRITPK